MGGGTAGSTAALGVDERVDAERAAQPPARAASRLPTRWILAGLGVAAFVAVSLLPWEWSLIDDGGMVYSVESHRAARGVLGGFVATVQEQITVDRGWGLFRPAWWVNVPVFYALPVGVAHAVRVAMLVVVFAAAVAVVVDGGRRLVRTLWTVLAIAADSTVLMGVWYPSLQELSGLCAVALGLFARRRPWLVLCCWLVAAWFKAPFAWLLLAHGLVLVRGPRPRSERIAGAAMVLAAVGTLGAATTMAHTGRYTAGALAPAPDAVYHNAMLALTALAAPALVVLAGVLALGARARRDPLTVTLLAGGAGYLLNLLPWKTDTHYSAPYVYLLTLGALVSLRAVPARPARAPAVAGLCAALAVTLVSAGGSAWNGWETHSTVTGLRDCVLRLPPGSVVGFNRPEAWVRLDWIAHRRDPSWTGAVGYVPDGTSTALVWGRPVAAPVTYYIHQPSYGPGTPALRAGPVVCRTAQATVYRVG